MTKMKIMSQMYLLLAVALFVGLLAYLKYLSLDFSGLSVAFILGFLLISGFIAGKIFSNISLPQLSGFIFIGMFCGPSFLSIIGPKEIQSLAPLNELALALIAIQAGAELSLKFLKTGTKSILLVILLQSLSIVLGMMATFMITTNFLGLSVGEGHASSLVAGIMFSVLAISKAPADTLAILGETKLKGAFANHILGVVVIIDILVIVLFQVVLLAVKPYVIPGAFFDLHRVLSLIKELFASIAAGFSLGILLILWFSIPKKDHKPNILFLILASFGVASMCHYLRYDSLLVFIVGGFVISNLSERGHSLIETVEKISHGVMIVFFATAGAMLDLEILKQLWPYALLLAFARIFFTFLGTYGGHFLAKDNLVKYRYSFSGYISQAGVTLVLAQSAAKNLGSVGENLAALCVAVVAINEFIGPVAFKLAIRREKQMSTSSAA